MSRVLKLGLFLLLLNSALLNAASPEGSEESHTLSPIQLYAGSAILYTAFLAGVYKYKGKDAVLVAAVLPFLVPVILQKDEPYVSS